MREARFLIVVDMQNDFIDGSLGTAEAQAIVDRAAEHIRRAMDEGVTVIATLDTTPRTTLTPPRAGTCRWCTA
jgi:nicotinamidase-related amidase